MKPNKKWFAIGMIVGTIITTILYIQTGCALLQSNPTLTLTTNGVVIDFKTNVVVIPIK